MHESILIYKGFRYLKFSLVMAKPGGAAATASPIELVVPVMVVTTTSQTQAEEEAEP